MLSFEESSKRHHVLGKLISLMWRHSMGIERPWVGRVDPLQKAGRTVAIRGVTVFHETEHGTLMLSHGIPSMSVLM